MLSRRDDGAVAVLVAILTSAVLLTLGALTVDLGSAWAARVGLAATADAAALAGAAALPDEDAAVEAAVRVLCGNGDPRPQWATSAICPSAGVPGWAGDGDPANGEVSVLESQEYPDLDPALDPPAVLQVVAPPVTVEFGLAKLAGFQDIAVRSTSGARQGLPYPADHPMNVAPFYLTLEDLRDAGNDAICLRVTARPTASSWPPVPDPTPLDLSDPANPVALYQVGTFVDATVPSQASAALQLTGATFGPVTGVVVPAFVTVYVGARDAAHQATTDQVTLDPLTGTYQIDLTTPDFSITQVYGAGVPVWFEYDDGAGTTGVSTATALTYPDPPADPVNDCDTVEEGRGLVDLPRADGSRGPGAATVADVRDGLDTVVHPFRSWPQPQAAPGPDVDCYDPSVSALVVPDAAPVGYVEAANCVPITAGAQVSRENLTEGMLGAATAAGRLAATPDCSSENDSVPGLPGSFDTTRLGTANGLVSPSVSTTELTTRLRSARPADAEFRDTITAKIFHCPRLFLVPVLDTSRLPADPTGHYPVVGLTYFWMSDVQSYGLEPALRGLIVDADSDVVGIRGWVIDPGYVWGGDWVDHVEADPDDALPLSVPERAVLVRTPGDDHPDNAP